MHAEHQPYLKFTSRSRFEKSVNSLIGIVEGIAIDGSINSTEIGFLENWLNEHLELKDKHPFNELVPVIESAIQDGELSEDERADILWLCERLTSTEFTNRTTADMQRLHAMLGGIVADGVITEDELRGLSSWMENHDHLKKCWPYEEVENMIFRVMADKKIDEKEHDELKGFFSEFIALYDNKTIVTPLILDVQNIGGLCAICPEIEFDGFKFCFTGASARFKKSELSYMVTKLGGEVSENMTTKTNFLVIGAEGNPSWSYACYGRKVERAVELRKSGVKLLIVHENDFHDAVADH